MTSKQSIAVGALLMREDFKSWNYVSILTLLRERSYTASQLAALTGLTTAAITGLTTVLDTKRFIHITRSTKDRRSYIITLTALGEAYLESIYNASHA